MPRIGPRHEVQAALEHLFDRVLEVAGAAQCLRARPGQLPAREAGLRRGGIDGDHAHRAGRGALVAVDAHDHVDDGVHHAALAAELVELAEEERLDARGELLGAPGLVEERDGHRVGLVLDVRLDERSALPGSPRSHRANLGEDHRLVPDGEVREVSLP
jgi:hypothetical protein